MKNTFKKIITVTVFLLSVICPGCAKSGVFNGEYYDIYMNYNDTTKPGDAVFIRMKFVETKKVKKAKDHVTTVTGAAKISKGEKTIATSDFYVLPNKTSDKKSKAITVLTGMGLSTWTAAGDYNITVTYNYDNGGEMEFEIPLKVEEKIFNEEKIPLDSRNTGIRTNTSPEKMKQIEKLNKVLGTVTPEDVYETGPFVVPVNCNRYTSYFGDRRTYVYNNGKTATTLHFGNDYGCGANAETHACGKGKVVIAENRISTGWTVVIEHLPGLYSIYYHNNELKVKEGDIVNQGDVISLSGATGLATGPHCHWEVRLNMEAVNPNFFTTDFTFENEDPAASKKVTGTAPKTETAAEETPAAASEEETK